MLFACKRPEAFMRKKPFDGVVLIVSSVCMLAACAKKHADVVSAAAGHPAASGGSGAAAGPSGQVSTDRQPGRAGATATAMLVPTANVGLADAGAPVSGTASFHQTAVGVDIMLSTLGCVLSKKYAVFIQEGTDCSEATLSGAHWDGARGEDIMPLACTGTTGVGRSYYTRTNDNPNPWTIGTPAASNILGHVLVIYDSTRMEPVACGAIARTADVPKVPASTVDAGVTVTVRAQLSGLCLGKMFVRDNMQECPNPVELEKCASEHCDVDSCVQQCPAYIACLKMQSDGCAAVSNCEVDQACADCQSRLTSCTLGYCSELLACASPIAPDGPCSKLEACCQMQGDGAAACLETVHLLEKYSGDPSCFGVMRDWDTTAHLAVPCKFE